MTVDLCLLNGRLVNVLTGEIYRCDLSIMDGKFWGFEAMPAHKTIDLEGRFIAPGFIEGHIHLESSHVLPKELVPVFLRNGVTTVVADPHEIANAGGLEGIRYLLKKTEDLPVDFYFLAPSCVPASPLETAGYTIGLEEIELLRNEPRVIGLGEMMNYPGVISGDKTVHAKCDMFCNGIIDGHAPGVTGKDLDAYIRPGIYSDHETADQQEALEKIRKGMMLMIREGSSAKNGSLLKIINDKNDSRFMIVSDDNSPADMANNSYISSRMERLVKKNAYDPVRIIRGLTINPAQYFRFHKKGAVVPGYHADCAILNSLDRLDVFMTIHNGTIVYHERMKEEKETVEDYDFPLSLPVREFSASDFNVQVPPGSEVRAIAVTDGQILTGEKRFTSTAQDGVVPSDTVNDFLKIAVIDRYSGACNHAVGFVHGIGLRSGALATTYNHDAHNIVVLGADDADMAAAVNLCVNNGGGIAFAASDVYSVLPFDLYGIMSSAPLTVVAEKTQAIEALLKKHGCTLSQALSTLSFLSLSVVPALKITDKGLIDVSTFSITELYV